MAVFTLTREGSFIPKAGGNDQDPKPVTFHHKRPTLALRQDLVPAPTLKMTFDVKGKPTGGNSELVLDNERIIRTMLLSIENLDVAQEDKDGKILRITDANGLFGPFCPAELGPMIEEVAQHFQKLLSATEVNEKN